MGAKGGGEASTAGWELFRLSDKRSGHLCAAVDELRRFDRRTPILVRQYTRLRTGDAPGTSCVTAQNCDGACADSPRCVRRPPRVGACAGGSFGTTQSRGQNWHRPGRVRQDALRRQPRDRCGLLAARARAQPWRAYPCGRTVGGCPMPVGAPPTACRAASNALAEAEAAMEGRQLQPARWPPKSSRDRRRGGRLPAAPAVAEMASPRRIAKLRRVGSECGGRRRLGRAKHRGCCCAALGRPQIGTRIACGGHNRIVGRVCVGTSCILHSFFVLARVTGTGDKSVDCVSFIAT